MTEEALLEQYYMHGIIAMVILVLGLFMYFVIYTMITEDEFKPAVIRSKFRNLVFDAQLSAEMTGQRFLGQYHKMMSAVQDQVYALKLSSRVSRVGKRMKTIFNGHRERTKKNPTGHSMAGTKHKETE